MQIRSLIRRYPLLTRPLLGLVLGIIALLPSASGNSSCPTLYARLVSGEAQSISSSSAPRLRFARGVARSRGNHVQFGFESEYGLDQAQGILNYYAPAPELGLGLSEWRAMSTDARLSWLQQNIGRVFPSEREPGKLILFNRPDGASFLPERLIRDSTGNIEFVTGPFDTLEEWYAAGSTINRLFGKGSMQAVLSTPRKSFFVGSSPRALNTNSGYFAFFSDYDTLEKLAIGYTRWQESPTKRTARSFEHPFLGPMTRQKRELMETHLSGHSKNTRYDSDTMKSISKSDDSYKYVGTSTYRPDIAGSTRPAIEVRDAHNNFDLLFEKLARNTFYLESGRTVFLDAARLAPFDPIAQFDALTPDVQQMLKTVFPNRAKPGVEYSKSERAALDVFRNFSWPMRDWTQHVRFLDQPGLDQGIASARTRYSDALRQIADDFKNGRISQEDTAVRVQGALVEFGKTSGLRDAFLAKESALALKTSGRRRGSLQPLEEIAVNSGPLQAFYPGRIMGGSMDLRMKAFASKYPNQVRMVRNVAFAEENMTASRTVIAISTSGMDAASLAAFTEDYLKHFSHETVSFPLSERGGHLYSRMGGKVVDYYGWWKVNPYAAPSSERLEALVTLTPEESLKLRSYIENVNANAQQVLGRNDYQGASAATAGTLTDNRPVAGGHNCTSWICTSPVGKDGETLYGLTGATRELDIHTNPGWWSSWLAAGAKAERVPSMIYWTTEPLDTALGKRVVNGKFVWNFARH